MHSTTTKMKLQFKQSFLLKYIHIKDLSFLLVLSQHPLPWRRNDLVFQADYLANQTPLSYQHRAPSPCGQGNSNETHTSGPHAAYAKLKRTNLELSIMLCRRCAMVRTVQCANSFLMVVWIRLSVSRSTAAVASSRINMRDFLSSARARHSSCRCPTLSVLRCGTQTNVR